MSDLLLVVVFFRSPDHSLTNLHRDRPAALADARTFGPDPSFGEDASGVPR
jgi:hypothetical protein